MLNDLIRKTNVLGRELAARRAAAKKNDPSARTEELVLLENNYKRSLDDTLRFVADNNVPRDTVGIIEDRILREMRIRDDEIMLREKLSAARAAVAEARKEADWLQRSVDSGLGGAQARFIQAKAKMDDFCAASARLPESERGALCDEFARLDQEYITAKNEFLRVGVTDRAALLNDLKAAQGRLADAQAQCAECEKQVEGLPLTAPVTQIRPGGGEICRALDGVTEQPTEPESDELPTAEVFEEDEAPRITLPETRREQAPATLDDELGAQISAAVRSMLSSNERFKYILEEVRFQASMEVAKVRAEVEKIKNEAFREAQRLTEELRRLKEDAAYIRQEAARAKLAMNTVNKAKATATLNAQRTVTAAKKTVAAARKAIDAAKTATVHKP